MSYVRSVLQKNEELRFESRLHWMVYVAPALGLPIAAAFLAFYVHDGMRNPFIAYAGLALAGFTAILFLAAWVRRVSTEIAVTNRRVIHKQGLVWRKTTEVILERIEGVDVSQSIPGRIFGFGTVTIKGAGTTIAPLHALEDPIGFSNAINAG